MNSQFSFYFSSDAGAPVLNGQAGSLLAVLDACLVDGYGSKSPLGWTKPFANSGNVGCYASSRPEVSAQPSYYLSVSDNAPHATALGREARATGFESLSGVSSGGGQFPASGQALGGYVVWRKSATADATARPWFLCGDSRTFYLFAQTGDTPGVWVAAGFGDFFSLSADTWRAAIWGRALENSVVAASALTSPSSSITTAVAGLFLARNYAGTVVSVAASQHGDFAKSSTSSFAGVLQYPNAGDNSLYVSPVWVAEIDGPTVRGYLRGLWQFCHPASSVADGDTFDGLGDLVGRQWRLVKDVRSVSAQSTSTAMALEISATVATND